MKIKRAFTLTEVFIALSIVGIVATMVVPTLYSKYKITEYSTRAKSTYSEISNAIVEILRDENAKTLSEISFQNNKNSLLSSKLDIISTDNKFNYSMQTLSGNSYDPTVDTVYKLTNGAMFSIANKGDDDPGYQMVIDTNGRKDPNTLGRDIFIYWIREKGSVDPNGADNVSEAIEDSDCSSNGYACAARLMENSWEMDY